MSNLNFDLIILGSGPGGYVGAIRASQLGMSVAIVEEDLLGASDDRVWEAAHSERRCLFTADKGFADARKYPPGTHDGIVLFRLPRESRLGYIRLLESLLAERELESLAGAIVTVSPDAIRVRRAEQGEV